MAEVRVLNRFIKRLKHIKARVAKYSKEATTIFDIRRDEKLLCEEQVDYRICEGNGLDEANEKLISEIDDLFFEVKDKLAQWTTYFERKQKPDLDANNTSMQELLTVQKQFIEDMANVKRAAEVEAKLPRLDIPKFSGKDETLFPAFKNMFEATIYNKNITNTHKFQHLKSLLIEDARQLMSMHIDITEENYVETWERIKKRYDKKRQSINTFINKFFDLPNVVPGSAKSLHQLNDISNQILRGLKALNDPKSELRDPWLIYILMRKMDDESRRMWAKESANDDFPSMEQFSQFLTDRCDELESYNPSNRNNNLNKPSRTKLMQSSNNGLIYPMCKGDHFISNCEQLLALNVNDRRGFAAQARLCFNCLSTRHQAQRCRSTRKCSECNRKHHRLLHTNTPPVEASLASTSTTAMQSTSTEGDNQPSITCANVSRGCNSLLPTATIQVKTVYDDWYQCRVLLDSGSESSFISENLANRLKLKREKANVIVEGLTGQETCKGYVNFKLKSRFNQSHELEIKALIIKRLPENIPSIERQFNQQTIEFVKNFGENIADPKFNVSGPIDIIISSEFSFDVLKKNVLNSNGLTAHDSIFGWIFTGGEMQPHDDVIPKTTVMHSFNLEESLRPFWELEEVAVCSPLSIEEQICEKMYAETTTRDECGRFVVRIPFRDDAPVLGNSHRMALQRFNNLEKKLQRNAELRIAYNDVINNYLKCEHMVEMKMSELNVPETQSYYLPHHTVFKPDSSTTKVRVVLDGSAKTSTGVSLNQKMYVGPTLQPNLWSILVRFRMHKVVITGDIEKMYRQVKVVKDHQCYQRVLWKEKASDPVRQYKLTSVTFGLANSAYLAIKSLQQLVADENEETKLKKVILNDFYVDDLLSGAQTIEEANDLKNSVSELLKTGGFELKKWKSNHNELRETSEVKTISAENDDRVKVLGLRWDQIDDFFSFKIAKFESKRPTKRQVISEYSRVFDPLGWLSPSIVLVKMLFQKLCESKCDWDDELSPELARQYLTLRKEFDCFEKIRVPRYLGNVGRIEYHGFCDASKKAYAAVIYMRSEVHGEVNVRIVTAKTKVAPLKTVTNAKLELLGAFLLATLVKEFLKICDGRSYAWTDSTQVLAYLSDYPGRWKAFVGNRTAFILEYVPRDKWNYINTKNNPADPASRGILPAKLVESELWWDGPIWLSESKSNWPIEPIPDNIYEEVEAEKVKLNIATVEIEDTNVVQSLLDKFSSFSKKKRVLVYVMRFCGKIGRRNANYNGPLSILELKRATNAIFKFIQQVAFADEIQKLKIKKQLSRRSHLTTLSPFLDDDDILRVGGRLKNYDGNYDYKHPIIIPRKYILAERIIQEVHTINLHPGPSLTFHLSKQKYWIVGGRSLVRKICKNCVRCFKFNARPENQFMGELPAVRLSTARAFTNTGVDYAGPIQILQRKGRGLKLMKAYIAVFICMVTKAIHIELVSDLATGAFLAALRRFVGRRGLPAKMYNDNGTNFVGANRQLIEVIRKQKSLHLNDELQSYFNDNGIEWHFIPPGAPNYGGLWEAAVKSVKSLMLKSISNTNLTFEELTTLLCQIESILNSRLIDRRADNDDSSYEVLTPGHFLIGDTPQQLPVNNIDESIPVNRLNKYQLIQQRLQNFWRQFHRDYIHGLQQREKWTLKKQNFKVGELVMISDNNLPANKWLLGRITEVFPDPNGTVRRVELKTKANIRIERHVNKLCRLPGVMMS